MKYGIIGCVTGSAAALLFGGCAADQYAATDGYRDRYVDGYRGSYVQTTTETQPVFVEQRSVLVDRQPRTVAVYRTGDNYFYTDGGRRYTLPNYPAARRTAVIETTPTTTNRIRYSRYQRGAVVDRPVVATGYTEDDSTAFRRTTVETPVVGTTTQTYTTEPVVSDGKSVVTERTVTPSGY